MLTSEIIRRVKEIQLRTGRHVSDVLSGGYTSVFRGSGVEFDEVRPYAPGDDVRSIDWNVTARSGAPYVKRYVEERQLTLMLLADISTSQDFGSEHRSKREATAEFCALLGFSAAQRDDNVGLVLFHSQVEKYIPPRKGQKHALRVVREVLAHGEQPSDQSHDQAAPGFTRSPSARLGTGLRRPTQVESPLSAKLPAAVRKWWSGWTNRRALRPARAGTRIAAALEFMVSVSKRRTVCFVVSDFFDEEFETALTMANRRHDVVAVLVTDPRERAFPNVGLIALKDSETGVEKLYDTGSLAFREALKAKADARQLELQTKLRRIGIDFIHVDASGSAVEPLVAFFRMRERRHRR